jgi:scavenger receptor class B, member 1
VPSGLFNVSSCRFGAPVFMSFPHFYNADPFYRQQVEGMTPEKDKHEFFIALEPVSIYLMIRKLITKKNSNRKICLFIKETSFPLEIAARFQLNLLIDPIPRFKMYKNVPRLFMPVVWFEQHVKASSNIAIIVKLILNAVTIGQIFGFILTGIGVFLIALILCTQEKIYEFDSLEKTENNNNNNSTVTQPLMIK